LLQEGKMLTFEDIKPGSRLRGLDPTGIAEVVQVARFGADALNLVFRVDGRVAERLVYRGEESSFEFLIGLQTAFGGGKTHTMLAVYHLAKAADLKHRPSRRPMRKSACVSGSIAGWRWVRH
jgi:hypothetical protein